MKTYIQTKKPNSNVWRNMKISFEFSYSMAKILIKEQSLMNPEKEYRIVEKIGKRIKAIYYPE